MATSSTIDMALDDIIRLNNHNRKRSRSSATATAARRFLGSSSLVRPASHSLAPAAPYHYPGPPTVPRMLSQMVLSGGDSGEGTKLYVSNLDYDVSNEDVKLLFSDVGVLKRYGIHCDRSGRSMGTAEVVFSRTEDAIAAIRRYDNARLDGKPLKIELVGANPVAPNYCYVEPYGAPMGGQRLLTTTQGHDRNTGRGPSQGGSGLRRSKNVKPTAEALDADLERYQLKAARASKFC